MTASDLGHTMAAATTVAAGVWFTTALVALVRPRSAGIRRVVGVVPFVTAAAAAAVCVVLARALVTNDFSLTYVGDTTSRATPGVYRLAALWGAMEGSLAFWIALQALVLALGLQAARRSVPHLRPVASVVGGGLVTALVLMAATWADPFATPDLPPTDGRGLVAVLQHPAMIYHPPTLYLGLVVLAVPFALTIAALLDGPLDGRWLSACRPWLRTSWVVLTVGMLAGSHWAYVELGWGGFWAWDPVENTALLPWLLVTIAVHAAMVVDRNGRAVRSTAAAVAGAFVVSAAGIYLTRSGGTGSIHAFAENEIIGRALLGLTLALALLTGVALVRHPATPAWRARPLVGRESGLALQAVLVGLAALVVAIGSFLPAVRDVAGGDRLLVKAGFYLSVLAPLAAVTVVLAALGPSLRWAGGLRRPRRAAVAAIGGAAVGVVLATAGSAPTPRATVLLVVAAAALSIAVVTIVAGLVRGDAGVTTVGARRRLGALLVHAGFALVLVGAAGSGLGDEATAFVAVGDSIDVGGRQVKLVSIDAGQGDRFDYLEARIEVVKHGSTDTLRPQLRAYEDQTVPTAEAALRSGLLGDFMVNVAVVAPDLGGARLEVFERPLVIWVWWGGLVMTAGGLLVLIAGVGRSHAESGVDAGPRRGATAAPPAAATRAAGPPGGGPT